MQQTPATRTVQTYNLFGEAGDLPDVVHCETIAARSVLHEWEFAAHRHARLHQILLIESGGGQATLEGRVHALRPMRVINVPVAMSTVQLQAGDAGLGADGGRRNAGRGVDAVRRPAPGVVAFDGDARHAANAHRDAANLRRIRRARFRQGAHPAALSAALIGLVARELAARGSMPGGAEKSGILHRFEALLDQHFLQHWTVSDYAAALSITPTHLSRLTRAATGHSASHLILDRLIREARRNLVYTSLPVSTIAYALGFNDPAYFSRLFSGATGLPPRSFRDKVHKAG